MDLIIEGHKAILKQGSSFEYVSENRSFSDADDYTLSITLPLAGCPENIEIFGHIDRMDADTRSIILEASIVDREFCKNGVVTVVETTDVDVKVQFLEGRSAQNIKTDFDDIYINEMQNLGEYPSSSLPEYVMHNSYEYGYNSVSAVALPWVNDSADGVLNNGCSDNDGYLKWDEETVDMGKLSYQPYLIYITKMICEELGYTYDFDDWENSSDSCLLICNTLPASWDMPQYAKALPHWSVTEFFEELEKILVCEIDIDHKAKHISLKKSDKVNWKNNEVELSDIVDSFSTEVSYDDALCEYKGIANIQYESRSDDDWKIQQCQWVIELLKQAGEHYYKEFDTYDEFIAWYRGYGVYTTIDGTRGEARGRVFHCLDNDGYYMVRVVKVKHPVWDDVYGYQLIRVNLYSDIIHDSESGNDISLKCVPVRIADTDRTHGFCMFLSPSEFSGEETIDENGIRQPVAYSTLMKGNEDTSPEYYDKIYLAYWTGHSYNDTYPYKASDVMPPAPEVDERFSLQNRYENYMSGLKISPKEKLKVSWLSSSIPNVRSVFYIKGKRYLCEKITATFTENGMSQLLKGEFYPLLDED